MIARACICELLQILAPLSAPTHGKPMQMPQSQTRSLQMRHQVLMFFKNPEEAAEMKTLLEGFQKS